MSNGRPKRADLPGPALCVFCGGSKQSPDAHVARARRLGEHMAEAGVRLIFGGGSYGLMGAVAEGCLSNGGEAYGIIPEFLTHVEEPLPGLTGLEVVSTMHIRTQRMYALSDAFCALPGGIGTLEEVLEFSTYRSIGLHDRPMILVNADGFWEAFFRMFDAVNDFGYLRAPWRRLFEIVPDEDGVIPALRRLKRI